MTPPTTFDADSEASAIPSMTPSAAACAPIERRNPGRAAVAISCPVSDNRLPRPMPSTPRFRTRVRRSPPRRVLAHASHRQCVSCAPRHATLRGDAVSAALLRRTEQWRYTRTRRGTSGRSITGRLRRSDRDAQTRLHPARSARDDRGCDTPVGVLTWSGGCLPRSTCRGGPDATDCACRSVAFEEVLHEHQGRSTRRCGHRDRSSRSWRRRIRLRAVKFHHAVDELTERFRRAGSQRRELPEHGYLGQRNLVVVTDVARRRWRSESGTAALAQLAVPLVRTIRLCERGPDLAHSESERAGSDRSRSASCAARERC